MTTRIVIANFVSATLLCAGSAALAKGPNGANYYRLANQSRSGSNAAYVHQLSYRAETGRSVMVVEHLQGQPTVAVVQTRGPGRGKIVRERPIGDAAAKTAARKLGRQDLVVGDTTSSGFTSVTRSGSIRVGSVGSAFNTPTDYVVKLGPNGRPTGQVRKDPMNSKTDL